MTTPDGIRITRTLGVEHRSMVVRAEHYPYLRWLLGFGGPTRMEYRVSVAEDPES